MRSAIRRAPPGGPMRARPIAPIRSRRADRLRSRRRRRPLLCSCAGKTASASPSNPRWRWRYQRSLRSRSPRMQRRARRRRPPLRLPFPLGPRRCMALSKERSERRRATPALTVARRSRARTESLLRPSARPPNRLRRASSANRLGSSPLAIDRTPPNRGTPHCKLARHVEQEMRVLVRPVAAARKERQDGLEFVDCARAAEPSFERCKRSTIAFAACSFHAVARNALAVGSSRTKHDGSAGEQPLFKRPVGCDLDALRGSHEDRQAASRETTSPTHRRRRRRPPRHTGAAPATGYCACASVRPRSPARRSRARLRAFPIAIRPAAGHRAPRSDVAHSGARLIPYQREVIEPHARDEFSQFAADALGNRRFSVSVRNEEHSRHRELRCKSGTSSNCVSAYRRRRGSYSQLAA